MTLWKWDSMLRKKVSVRDGDAPKELRIQDQFLGHTHFPKVSPALRLSTIIALIALTIAVSVVVWWLRS
jgi:hypothetical protein